MKGQSVRADRDAIEGDGVASSGQGVVCEAGKGVGGAVAPVGEVMLLLRPHTVFGGAGNRHILPLKMWKEKKKNYNLGLLIGW